MKPGDIIYFEEDIYIEDKDYLFKSGKYLITYFESVEEITYYNDVGRQWANLMVTSLDDGSKHILNWTHLDKVVTQDRWREIQVNKIFS